MTIANLITDKGREIKKIVIRNYTLFPQLWQIGFCLIVLVLFNVTTWPYMKFGLENSVEASFFWVDEGGHIQTLENMQENESFKLLHPAYTAFYPNLSYLTAWLIDLGQYPISSKAFALGSKWVSLISVNLHLLMALALCYSVFSSFGWAFLGLILLAAQRFNLIFATRMHPEGLMLLFTALALYAGTRLMLEGKLKFLWGMAAATGLAIGTKLQMVFLIPWGSILFVLVIWKFWPFSMRRISIWIFTSGLVLILSFFVASPYQLIHFSELLQGVLGESQNITDYYQGRYSAWKWVDQITSELHLGPFFSTLFVLSFFIGGKRLITGWQQYRKFLLNQPQEVFFILNILWIIIGGGYIVATYKVFTDRYLIHIHISFIFVILLGLYWWNRERRPFYNMWVKFLIFLCLYGGIQGQWRHTRRDVERREKIHALLEPHRRFGRELPQHVPFEANVLHTIRVYISHQLYPHAEILFGDIASRALDQENLDYLIVNNKYRPAMRSVPMRGSQQDTIDAINFWKNLEKDGIQGMFSVVAHYPEIDVTIYRKVKTFEQ